MSATDGPAPLDTEGRPAPGLPDEGAPEVFDLAVVGGGPAGLHAALKAALLFKTCVLFDKGRKHSRIFYAPKVDNVPGHPEGIRGSALIQQGHDHIEAVERQTGRRFVDLREGTEVTGARQEAREEEDRPLFVLETASADGTQEVRARNLVLATGAIDQQPITREYRRRDIETILPYANKGLADYCLLCDGHLVEGKRVAVIGCGASAATVAASLKKNFHAETTLVTCGGLHPDHPEEGPEVPPETRAFLEHRDIPIIERHVKGWFGLKENQLGIEFEDGTRETFDKGWISMGWYKINSELAVSLGAATADDGTVETDRDCEALDATGAKIRGLFAIGDVRAGSWNQIPIAWGEAETAVVHAFAHYL